VSFLKEFNEIYMNLTYRCNLDCPFCSTKFGGFYNKNIDMSEEVAIGCIDILLNNSTTDNPQLFFFGGEPLLRMDLIKTSVDYGRKHEAEYNKNIRFAIVTNGVLLNDDFLDYLSQNEVELQINLDGPKENHDKLRYFPNGDGTFDIIIKNIKKAEAKEGVTLAIRSHMAPDYIHFHETMDMLKSMNIININIAFTMIMGMEKDSEFLWKKEDYLSNENLFLDFVRKYAQNILLMKYPTVDFFGLYGYYSAPECKLEHFCDACRVRLSISPNGDIYPCFPYEDQEEFWIGHIDKGISTFNVTRFLTIISESGIVAEDKSDIKDIFKYFCPYQNWTLSGKLNVVSNVLKDSCTGFSIIVEKMKDELGKFEKSISPY